MYITQTVLPKQKIDPLSEAEYNQAWAQEKQFKVLKRYNDPRFGDITVIKSNSNQVLLVKEKMSSSKNEATEDINYLKKRMDLNHPHLMKLVGISSSVNKELCSTTFIVKGFYEFPRTDAFKELSERKKIGQDFNHVELTHFIYQALAALHNVHHRSLAHGDIRPQLIGYDKANNHFDILDRLSDASLIDRYQINQIVNNRELYLSPELYKKLKGKDKNAAFDHMKNDIFALGLTLLYLGTSESPQNIYKSDGEIEHRYLHEHVMNFDIKFNDQNPFLCNLLKTLLQIRESDRPDAALLFKNMPSYDEFKRSEGDVGIKLQMSNYHYHQPEATKVNSQPLDQTAPIHNNNSPYATTTYVRSIPQSMTHTQTQNFVNSAPHYNESRVINSETRHVNNGNRNMQFYNAESYFDANGNKVIRRSYGNDTKVEVRRGSPSPIPSETRVIKKRYVMREDGTVVEIDPNLNLNTEDIRKYFDPTHNTNTIAHYDNVDQAINSEGIDHDQNHHK